MILSKADLTTLLGDSGTEYSDAQLEHAAAVGSAAVESYCGRSFLSQVHREWVTGSGETTLVLEQHPVQAIYRVSTDFGPVANLRCLTTAFNMSAQVRTDAIVLSLATAGGIDVRTVEFSSLPVPTLADLSAVLAAQVPEWWKLDVIKNDSVYILTPDMYSGSGVIELQGAGSWDNISRYQLSGRVLTSSMRWPRRVYVEYQAGYSQADIPADVRQAAFLLAKMSLDASQHGSGIKSETIGDYKYELFDAGSQAALPGNITSLLDAYRSVRL